MTDSQFKVDLNDAGVEHEVMAALKRIEARLLKRFRDARSMSNVQIRAQAEATIAKAKAPQQGDPEGEKHKYQAMLKEVVKREMC